MKHKLLIILIFINAFIVFNVEAKYVEEFSMCIAKIEKADTKNPSINGRDYDVYDEIFYEDVVIEYEDNIGVKYAKYILNSEEKILESGTVFSENGKYRVEVSDMYGNIVLYEFEIQKKLEKVEIAHNGLEINIVAEDELDGIQKLIVYVDNEIYFEKNYLENQIEILEIIEVTNEFYQEVYVEIIDGKNNKLESNKIIINSNEIYTIQDLIKFSQIVNSNKCTFENMEVNLMNNLNGVENLEPINGFKGTFNGNNYVIVDYKYLLNNDKIGLFGTNYGTIKNLEIIGYIENYGSYISGICAENYGTIYNCVSGVTINALGDYVAGITSFNYGTVELCKNNGSVTTIANFCGGIVGYNKGKILKCGNYGLINGTEYVGGISGLSEGIKNENVILECFNRGEICGNSYVAGILRWGKIKTCRDKLFIQCWKN